MLIIRNLLISFFGIFLFALTKIIPLFTQVYFDWIGICLMLLPWILDVWDMYREQTILQTDTCKKWEVITDYIDRNRDVHSLKTYKPYHTQSFLEQKGFGLIENLGKDSVLKKGRKKYVLALENCEHTPDPAMMTASEILYNDMGIRNTDTLKKLLSGKYLTAAEYKIMGMSLVAMMTYHNRHGGHRLVEEWKNYDGANKPLKPEPIPNKIPLHINTEKIHDHIDDLLKKEGKGEMNHE